ncbi:ASCH domain-containing protein [Methanimicrococcus blatticola]|uniref:Putative transcriptional regulator n=1 Tax=Methanimicrococcus blatticola TaxID=91560 RepID=A0A484F6M6_9EURY|nr:ASCH domain-containing protein [Methanimicrococcus blatticola]MBZ3935728.1 ASCH domain-containing protein [Methanimicrococcus blatticola]MCC2508152.1 ASCH domain-containing protein [Methanimicrococcus blatticola]TDQ68771.1 putative transcriptional regulator [Methanimicrococcus blatticola]
MSSIVLSIKPEYAKQILSGLKLYEYRKSLPQKKVDTLILYSTTPEMKVVGEAKVINVISASPADLWEQTKTHSGISYAKYLEYFKGKERAYAFQIGDVIKYETPKNLSDYGLEFPPQSFVYFNNGKKVNSQIGWFTDE